MFWKRSPSYGHFAGFEHINSVFSYSLVLTGDPAQAEDLVQKTYLLARQTWKPCRDINLKIWILTLLRKLWLNEPRHMTPGTGEHRHADHAPAHHVSELYALRPAARTEMEQVREAIGQLPVEFREVILLREFEELSEKEIASIVCCEREIVKSRLAIARSRLCRFLSSTLKAVVQERQHVRNESA